LLLPFLWVSDCVTYVWVAWLSGICLVCAAFMRRQAHLFVHGREPYVCAMRFTVVNFVVLCSTWFIFMDQARLAFFPASADESLTIVNLVAWCVLVVELLFQLFVRPEGYRDLIFSEKAFSPSTVRYINAFHLFVESLSLAIYLPEFLCLFNGQSCGQALPFSFHHAAIIGVIGPRASDVFYGHAYVALIRLRVFSMVRHWRNFWIAKTFVNTKSRPRQSGFLSNIGLGSSLTGINFDEPAVSETSTRKKKGVDEKEQKKRDKDATLTNASHIGTALMATNSYRALASAWAIIGLLPLAVFLESTLKNRVTYLMTDNLQATNQAASDISADTCGFLLASTGSWIMAVASATYSVSGRSSLLTVDIQPYRCAFNGNELAHIRICDIAPDLINRAAVDASDTCDMWYEFAEETGSNEEIAEATGIRVGSILEYSRSDEGTLTVTQIDGAVVDTTTTYEVITRFDQTFSIKSL